MGEENFVAGKISIIIPVYNVKEYLDKCIQSVVLQTYRNIEIIIVDDGSNDGSELICDEWGKKDNRIRVFHKKNGGLADARNFGLMNAKGEFVGFIDSDDYIKSDMYENLFAAMEEEVDIACCGTVIVYPDKFGRKPDIYDKAPQKLVMNNSDAMKELLMLRYLSFSACDKLFRRNLFDNITFPIGKICEDIPTIYYIVKKSRNVVNIGENKYFYFYREGSLSRKKFEIGRMSYVTFARDICQDIRICYPSLNKVAEAMYIKNVVSVIHEIENSNEINKYRKIKKKLIKVLERMQFRIFPNQYILSEMKKDIIKLIMWNKIQMYGKGI